MIVTAGQDAGEAGAPETWYQLDSNDCLVAIGGEQWDTAGTGLIGSRIYDHVSGHFTRKFLREFFGRARRGKTQTRQCYRCDTPDTKRLIEMRAELDDQQVLRVAHRLLAASALPHSVEVRDVPRPRARQLRCSSCNRLRGRTDQVWREPEDALKAGETALVVHTICPECRHGIDLRRQEAIFRTVETAKSPSVVATPSSR